MTMQIANTTATAKGAAQPNAQAKAELEKTAKAFEAIFLRQMISTMRSSSLGEGLTDNGGSDQFLEMSDSRTADNMAETGKFGIADLLMKQLGAKLNIAPAAQTTPGEPAA
ncbi:rod-binding protein [Sphingobium sp. SCG-1]|uniref:rod-binding protein n=1 Tax=Sphingobium sp. SCG-1 TaxID=2072936 RepID=UPI0026D7D88D